MAAIHSRELVELENDLSFLMGLLMAARQEVSQAKRYEQLKEARPGGPSLIPHMNKGLEQASLTLQKVEDYIRLADGAGGLRVKDQVYRWRISPAQEAIHSIELDHAADSVKITYNPNIFNFQVGEDLIKVGDILRIVGPVNPANAGVFRVASGSYSAPTATLALTTNSTAWDNPTGDYPAPRAEAFLKDIPYLTGLATEGGVTDRVRLDWWFRSTP